MAISNGKNKGERVMEKEKKKLNTYTFQSVAFFEANVHADIEAESEEEARKIVESDDFEGWSEVDKRYLEFTGYDKSFIDLTWDSSLKEDA